MGRELRRVPADWSHPRGEDGRYRPLIGGDYEAAHAEWAEHMQHWLHGEVTDWDGGWLPRSDGDGDTFAECWGDEPAPGEYMPNWPEAQRTHCQMYETCSNGTPISPVMASVKNLARWLADHGASAFGGMTATYEEWLQMCRVGWSFGAMVGPDGVTTGVAACSTDKLGEE
jgi:hypothetical protein